LAYIPHHCTTLSASLDKVYGQKIKVVMIERLVAGLQESDRPLWYIPSKGMLLQPIELLSGLLKSIGIFWRGRSNYYQRLHTLLRSARVSLDRVDTALLGDEASRFSAEWLVIVTQAHNRLTIRQVIGSVTVGF
jgi:hypothetical protein